MRHTAVKSRMSTARKKKALQYQMEIFLALTTLRTLICTYTVCFAESFWACEYLRFAFCCTYPVTVLKVAKKKYVDQPHQNERIKKDILVTLLWVLHDNQHQLMGSASTCYFCKSGADIAALGMEHIECAWDELDWLHTVRARQYLDCTRSKGV